MRKIILILNITFVLISIFSLRQSSTTILGNNSFKCSLDGLFEDENDCHMYYECLWIGTAFEKQEHIRCADKLIYNPRKHRCDDINEFEGQFANGVQTGEELLEFMRFRNCIGFKNLLDESILTTTIETTIEYTSPPADYYPQVLNQTKIEEEILENDKIYFDSTKNNEVTSLPTPTSTTTSTSTTTFTIPTTIKTESAPSTSTLKITSSTKQLKKTTKLLQYDEIPAKLHIHKSKFPKNRNKSSKGTSEKPINLIRLNSTESNATIHKQPFQTLYLVQDERLFIGKKSVSSQSNIMNNKLIHDELVSKRNKTKPSVGASLKTSNQEYKIYIRKPVLDTSLERLSIINNSNMNGTRLTRISSALNNKIILDKEFNRNVTHSSTNDLRTTAIPVFRGRKLLSIDLEFDEAVSHNSLLDDETTTTVDDEEIESKDSKMIPDKDEIVHEFTNQIMKNFNQSTSTDKNVSITVESAETRLSKRGKSDNSSTTMQPATTVQNKTNRKHGRKMNNKMNNETNSQENQEKDLLNKIQAKLIYGYLRNSTIPSLIVSKLFENDQNNPLISAIKKPFKLVKLLPKLNQSITEDKLDNLLNESSKRKLDQLLESYLNEIKANKSYSALAKELESDELKILKYLNNTLKKENLEEEFTEPINPSLFKSKNITLVKHIQQAPSTTILPTKSTQPKTKLIPPTTTTSLKKSTSKQNKNLTLDSHFIPITTFKPVKTSNSKPFLQTYRINQTKKLPNQFASLKLNYDRNSQITKIDEVERGGKFQRLRIIPTDTLIECKENDFGLECSCSITLSPPKCKQLINSFLSSCRILGCKNNGRCINMAYKYPIPYVCSCPGAFMGTYCEIPREDYVENDMKDNRGQVKSDRYSNKVTAATKSSTYGSTPAIINPFLANNRNVSTFINQTLTNSQTNQQINKKSEMINSEVYFKEPVCEPNPCLNGARCTIITDSFICKCLNNSYSGRYCEKYIPPQPRIDKLQPTVPARVTYPPIATTYNPYLGVTNQEESITESSTHRYFWNCPSNCLFHLGRGYCALSPSGFPNCVCRNEYTGIDCSQQNYCLRNKCSNNSTCFNYPEMKSYLCICQKGFTGRKCDIDLRLTLGQTSYPPRSHAKNLMIEPFSKSIDLDETHQQQQQFLSSTQLVHSSTSSSQMPIHPCQNEKCKNNGTCIMTFSHAKNKFSFICKCPPGYYGELCELRENACVPNPCKAPTTECIPLGYQKYECVCGNGVDCLQTTTSTKPAVTVPETTKKIIITTNTISTKKQSPSIGGRMFNNAEESSRKINKPKIYTSENNINPCNEDPNLCLKYPYGNESFICVKSFISQDYTLCLPTRSMNCKESNPCLNGGVCLENSDINEENKPLWKCICPKGFTGSLCETEICSPVHRLFSNHTMCQSDSPNLESSDGVAKEDMELILDVHNTLRRQVAPLASNMQKMYWDVRLQHLAQKRSQLCSVENTGILMRQQPGYGIVIGENLAAGYEKWSHVLSSWMSEKKNFIYKSTSPSDNSQAGHYTQMIYSSASRIGCGFSQCSNTTYDRYFVCYYGEMQTYYSRYEPYQDGKICSQCEKNCDNGLCDCGGAFCSNGGTMDLKTCTCTCPYSTFSGRYCENVICPKEDSPFCSQSLFEDKCWLYPVVRATCPYMCSLCTKYNENSNMTMSINSNSNLKARDLSAMEHFQDLVKSFIKQN